MLDDSRFLLAPIVVIWMVQAAVPLSEPDLQYPRVANDNPTAKKEPGNVLAKLSRVDAESKIDKTVLVDLCSSEKSWCSAISSVEEFPEDFQRWLISLKVERCHASAQPLNGRESTGMVCAGGKHAHPVR